MLNKGLLLEQLQAVSDSLFLDTSAEFECARASWARIIADPLFVYKVRQIQTPWLVPDWYALIGQTIAIATIGQAYTVLAVDGSQVYPDRHQGTSCFLINIGTVQLSYGQEDQKPVTLESKPFVFSGEQQAEQEIALGPELVNCRRQELELYFGIEKSKEYKKLNSSRPFLFLFDGSLIFWHLESKGELLKDAFLNKYLSLLDALYQDRILCAGYISMPKSKELVNLIRVELCKFKLEGCKELAAVDHMVDSIIASFFLSAGSRSIIFKSNAKIGALYPEHLMPHFFYCDIGTEIVRIEIPAWIAKSQEHLALVAQIILDQAIKGRGYPVALAEAHEQAVVKGPDREFFYHVITKLGLERQKRFSLSQKSLKKRGIGI